MNPLPMYSLPSGALAGSAATSRSRTSQPSTSPPTAAVVPASRIEGSGQVVQARVVSNPRISPPAGGEGGRPSAGPEISRAKVVGMADTPLRIQATVLQSSDYLRWDHSPLLAEEGDVLYPVLAKSCVESLCPLRPMVSLPTAVSRYVVHDHFRALLCFYSEAGVGVSGLRLQVDHQLPSAAASRRVCLFQREWAALGGEETCTAVAEMRLDEPGIHILHVIVHYQNPAGEPRVLQWSTPITAELGIVEVPEEVELRAIPDVLPSLHTSHDPSTRKSLSVDEDCGLHRDDLLAVAAVPLRHESSNVVAKMHMPNLFSLSVSLRNGSSAPLILSSVRLAGYAANAMDVLWVESSQRLVQEHPDDASASSNLAAGREDAQLLLPPGATRRATFVVQFSSTFLRQLRRLPSAHTTSPPRANPVTRDASQPNCYLGVVEWEWQSIFSSKSHVTSGDSIRITSISAGRDHIVDLPSCQLCVQGLDFHNASQLVHAGFVGRPAMPLRVGQPLKVRGVIQALGRRESMDVALKIRPEVLAEGGWLYAGAAVRPLGRLVCDSSIGEASLPFSLELVPWRPGWLNVRGGALQLVDAKAPEQVLWPSPSSSSSSSRNIGMTSNDTPVPTSRSTFNGVPSTCLCVVLSGGDEGNDRCCHRECSAQPQLFCVPVA